MFYNELQEMKEFFYDITPKEMIAGFAAGAGLYGIMIALCEFIAFTAM